MDTNTLSKEEVLFCELYANGDIPFAGDETRCYQEAFCYNGPQARSKALRLLSCEHIQQYLEENEKISYKEAYYMKKFITRNLQSIVTECSTKSAINKNGIEVSPAPLRSVAVSAAKALMEMYPVKEAQKLNIGSSGEGNITFNVVIPEKITTDTSQE